MKTNRHRASWLAGLLGLTVLLFVNQTVQAQAVRGLTNIAGKWGSGTHLIAAGFEHTCALTGDGLVRCWGYNGSGQLGDGGPTSLDTVKTAPVVVKGVLTDAVAISASISHTCGVRANGRIMCWGRKTFGQLGDGSDGLGTSTPVGVSGITNAISVSAGLTHTCALLATGQVACWGRGDRGQVGDDNLQSTSPPVTVANISNAVMVAAGNNHTCALLATGHIMCWGLNDQGQMGNGRTSNTPQPRPTAVSGITNAVSIDAGVDN